MGTHVGEVEIYVDLDGRRIPIQTRKLAEETGKALDQQFKGLSRRFDGISKDIDRIGNNLERAFTLDDIGDLHQVYETFDEIDASSRRAAIGAGSFRDQYDGIIEDIGELRQVADSFDGFSEGADRASRSTDRMTLAIESNEKKVSNWQRFMRGISKTVTEFIEGGGGGGGIDGLSSKLDNNSLAWGNLSHNTRQWTLIIGAVAAAMSDLAVLSSAAGAGLIAVGGAGLSLVAGIGAGAAVFTTLAMDLDKLPESLRPVAAEFKAFGKVFGEVRTVIASAAFKQMPGTFDSLGSTVRSLNPGFSLLGSTVGALLKDLSTNVRPGTEAFRQLDKALANANPNFDSLARSSGTLGLALVRSFNRAQPLVEDLTGYVERLVNQFDAFTRSRSFDDWIARSQTVFGSLGGLLDATGRALNDLVTPAAVNRLVGFLDNLTGFMPSLSQLLDTLGRLDLFGLAAQLLNEFGAALAPLEDPVGDLAEALSGQLSTGISAVARILGSLATAFAPVVEGVAGLVDAIPPDLMAGLVNGLGVAVGALALFKGAAGISGAITALGGWTTATAKAAGATDKFAGSLTSGLGKAGAIGGIAVGFGVAAAAAGELERAILDLDNKARQAVGTGQSFKDSYAELGTGLGGVTANLTDVSGALDGLASVGENRFKDIFGYIGSSFSDTGKQAGQLARTLGELDAPIATLANQNLPAAQQQFAAWARELGATDSQVLLLLDQMPAFKQSLVDASLAAGQTATDQDLLKLALGGTVSAADEAGAAAARLGQSLVEGVANAAAQEAALATLEGRAATTGQGIDDLANKIRGFGSAQLDSREANRAFEEAIDSVTKSIEANGTSLDITTAAGRANEASLDSLAQKALNAAAATLEQTGSQDQATAAINRGRDELRQMLGQFGITGQAAEDYIDKLGLVPENVTTAANLTGVGAAESSLNHLARDRTVRVRVWQDGSVSLPNGMVASPMATGGTLYGPKLIYAGEAGPEAIVPLNRPLADVDPSVRWLSAIAQNKIPAPTGQGGGGGGDEYNFQPGAIVVQDTTGDARRTAIETHRAIVEAASS